MEKIITLLFSLIIIQSSAQDTGCQYVNDSTKNIEHLYSSTLMPECYSSEHLKKLIPQKERYKPIKIEESDFKKLNAYEHFIHAFYYPEWYFQSCSMFPYPKNVLQTIPALIKRQGEGLRMSIRQEQAISRYRDSTILLIRNCITQTGKINDDFKRAIVTLNAFELIPTLISAIENQSDVKDPYILTTLCLLMRFDYDPFINSDIFKELYQSDSIHYNFSKAAYKNSIPFTHENFKAITNWSKEYYAIKSSYQSDFVQIPYGTYEIGEQGHSTNPLRKVKIQPFQISRYEITNKKFKTFVESTGYITLAEKNKDAFVFKVGLDEFEWIQDSTANWKFPNGISSGGINNKMDHPVCCISFIDALAYCKWAKVRLPTIEEWEVASRGNSNFKSNYFGDSLNLIHEHANIWHGQTHLMKDKKEDYLTTSPVGIFKPNPIGIYDIYGNVFEFCLNTPEAFNELNNVAATRGGSWWCSKSACGFFNSIDIGRVQKEASFSNNGFRVVR